MLTAYRCRVIGKDDAGFSEYVELLTKKAETLPEGWHESEGSAWNAYNENLRVMVETFFQTKQKSSEDAIGS